MATTRDYERLVRTFIDPKVADNIYNATPLLARFRKNAKMRGSLGRQIIEPLEYAVALAGSYADLALIDRSRKEVTMTASFDLAQYRSPLTVSWKDQLVCRGEEDVVNLLQVKARNAEKHLSYVLSSDLISGDGTGTGGETTIVGLATMLPTSAGTVGGLSQSTYTWWANQTTNMSSADVTLAAWIKMMGKCKDGNEGPSIAITDKFIWADVWADKMQPQERYVNATSYKMGEDLPTIAGLPILYDAACESSGATGGKIFFVDEDSIFLRVHSADNFKRWPYMQPADQYAFTTSWSWSGAMVCNKLKTSGVIYGVTTT